MRILILGGDGMLGHHLLQFFQFRHDVKVTLRRDSLSYIEHSLFNVSNSYFSVDILSIERITEVLREFHPDAVINCIGLVKQRSISKESIPSIEINALFPHRLSVLCALVEARLVHISTDCIFSGRTGNYNEKDVSDAEDLYGRTKFLGEVYDRHCLTLRTSIIGKELSRKKSLLEWFLAQRGTARGFRNAIYSGLTALELSRVIESILVNNPHASGLYHVSSSPISKYNLLLLFKKTFDLDIQIVADDVFCCDRSLDSTKFRKQFNYKPPTWDKMVSELSEYLLEKR